MKNRKAKNLGINTFALVFVLLIAFPFFWLVLASFKNMRELYANPVQFWPTNFSFANYIEAFTYQPLMRYIKNSFAYSFLATAVIIAISCMASFSLARTKIRGKKLTLLLLLTIALLPPVTLLNPIYLFMSKMKLLNTTYGLALVMVAIELPSAVWYMTSFFQSIPFEMEESATIDGANIPQLFTRILIPIISPGIFTISIMTFINTWNNFIFASVLNPTTRARTVTVALTMFQGETYTPWNLIAAAAVSVSVPLILIVLLLQRKIISGMMEGGVKG